MAKNRVRQTSTTTGTGDLSFAATPTGFVAFASAYTPGGAEPIYYVVEGVNEDGTQTGEWEVGRGQLTAGGALHRDVVHASSNSGALVNFSTGTKRVYDSVTVESVDSIISAHAAVTSGVHGITAYGSTLVAASGAGAARSVLGLGNSAIRDVGTGASDVAVGTTLASANAYADALIASLDAADVGAAPSSHATQHQDGGSDEIATTTAAAGAIPKADASGLIPSGFLVPVTTDGIVATAGNDWGIPGEWITTGGSTVTVPSGGALHIVPFTCLDNKTLDELLCEVTTAGAGGTVGQFAVYEASIGSNGQYVIGDRIYLDSTTFAADSTGLKTSTTSPNLSLVRGRSYALAVSLSDACSLRASLTVGPGLRNRRNAASGSFFMRIDRYGATGNHPPPATAPTIVLSQTASSQPNFNIPIWARWTVG